MKRLIILIIALVISITFMLERSFRGVQRLEGSFPAMGGIPINVVAYGVSRRKFKQQIRLIAAHVGSLEDVYSEYRSQSDVSKLNSMGKGCATFSPTLVTILKKSHRWYEITDGAFDVTVGPLIELWKDAAKKNKLPTESEIAEAQSRVGMNLVRLEGKRRICLERDGMSIALGGIAKGAIIDRAARVLKANEIHRGLVDAGGDVSAFGSGTFKIGLQDPTMSTVIARSEATRQSRWDGLLATITVPAGGVVTSGDYERFVTIEGTNYSHIIDPRSGKPIEGSTSVTVLGPNATDADALATAISVMGKEKGIALMQKLQDQRAIIISNDGSAWCSNDITSLVEWSEENSIRCE